MNQSNIDILQIIENNNNGQRQLFATNGFHKTKTPIRINKHGYVQNLVGETPAVDVSFDARALCDIDDCRCNIADQKILAYDFDGIWYALESFEVFPAPQKTISFLEYHCEVREYLDKKRIPLNMTTLSHAWKLSLLEIQAKTFTPIQAYDRSVRILSKGKQTVLPE